MTYTSGLLYQPDCHLCPLQHDKKVYPDGPIPALQVIVGEEPGHTELEEGRGFIGPSGQLLWHLGRPGGLIRDETWVSYAALCKARAVRLATGAILPKMTVKALAVHACRKRLLWELMVVTQRNPRAVIIPVGNYALRALTHRKGAKVYAYRGSILNVDLERLWRETWALQGLELSRTT